MTSMDQVKTVAKYYIDAVEQAELPTRPDANTNIVLNDTACIGYPDTVDQERADFKFITRAVTEQEVIDQHDSFVNNSNIIFDDNGEALYTDDGELITI